MLMMLPVEVVVVVVLASAFCAEGDDKRISEYVWTSEQGVQKSERAMESKQVSEILRELITLRRRSRALGHRQRG
jgi:hypothetical protein